MRFTYTPEGADPKSWPFEPAKLMSPEAEAIERVTGLTFVKWQDDVLEGSVRCIHALLWVLLKRQQPTLQYEQVVFSMSEIDFDFTPEERAQIREQLQTRLDAGEELTPEELDALRDFSGDAAPLDTAPASSDDASSPSS